ncbi:sprouty-related, EVH1 domain-containing protein 2 [Trichonephila inaurata madagascariensis]|uniref:Sprouty-related, EVH1 domain-containing protein 2 n=1 Tax=Trichonephila inaurata madagascariensis TaxID=2747483 RepID=A0A8X7CMJ3_9ARAC|nr:sprouty-related, EVH1 domain-containing protein 2 [Trichonephila inaurata madagascariensis]
MEGSHEDGNSLVRVRAQVMTRDDSTGGWVPMGAGGLSFVSVCKGSVSSEDDKVEYLIFGRRVADQSVVLSCSIKKDFQYNKVMPTFHHWSTGDKKFGLTFQTAADGRAFDKGVRMAIEDLSDGIGDFPNFHDSDIGEDDVFMVLIAEWLTLELPIDSHSSSGSSSFSGGSFRHPLQNLDPATSPYTHPHANHHHLHRMNFIRSPRFPAGINPSSNNNIGGYVPDPTQHSRHEGAWTKDPSRASRKDYKVDFDKIEMAGDLNSYVQLSRDKGCRTDHDYSYPVVDSYGKSGSRDGSLKKTNNFDAFNCQTAPRLPVKAKRRENRWRRDPRRTLTIGRAQCRHCLEMYSPEDNRPGSCEYAPDAVLKCVNGASCIYCAQCMLYHCMSDSEGDFSQHPCSCDMSDGHCPKRWTALTVLSMFVPCLWCYLPFRACHRCGIRCGVCGGKHDPA